MALFARQPQPPELYGILDDAGDLYKQLNRPTSDYEALGRYPSFHPPAGSSSSSGVVGSNPTGEVSSYLSPASAAGHSHADYSQSKRSPRTRPSDTSHEDSQPSQVSADPTGQSWFNPEAEVWKPKKSSTSNKMRKAPPARPQPQVPQQQAAPPVMYSYGSPAPPQGQPLTGILIKEPPQQFERTKGPPRKSAMKTPSQQPSPLPTHAYLAPVPTGYSTQTPRQPAGVLSPPSTVTNLSINPPPNTGSWISAPPSSAGRRSAANSHYGSSTGTSSVAFSSSYYSSSAPRSATHGRVPYEDDSPIEPSGPRQTLFVVNKDPDSGSEKSPGLDRKPFVPNMPSSSSKPRRKHKLSDAPVPPVPSLPPQFQAPPPPSYPPPAGQHQRARSDLDAPSNSRSGRDRDRSNATKRNRTEGHSQPPPSNPIPFPPGSKYSSKSGGSRNHHHHLSGVSSSSSGDDASSSSGSSSSHPRYDRSKVAASATSSAAEGSIAAEWIYPLPLTLEELFKGGTYTYRITTRLLSGEPKIQEVQIDVKPGWKTGTRIIFPDAGNERAPGVFQTMIFVVEQVHHERFTRREGGKLVYNAEIDLVDALKENGKREVRKV
ncbi:hypothetical protein FRC00_004524, partial [Tulasnella sp. 408]